MKSWLVAMVTLLVVAFVIAVAYLGFLMLTGPRK